MKNLKIKLLFALCAILLFSAFITEKKDVITIFMIGDSTMANKSLKNGNLERGWGQMLPCFLTEDVAVDNHAMNGRSSLSFINEGRWDAVLAKLKKGDYVFIQFEYLNSPRRVAEEMDVPFVDLNKLTHDLVVDMGVEKSKSLFMWVPAGIYDFCPKGKIDNTHLNIYGGKVVAGIAMEAVAKVVPALAPYVRQHDPEVHAADYKDNKISFFILCILIIS